MELKIPERKFLQYCLFAPVVTPILCVPLASATETGARLFLPLAASLLYGGLPYALFAPALVIWSRHRTASEIVRAGWISPLLFAPIAGLFVGLLLGYQRSEPDFAVSIGMIAVMYVIVIGYSYVILVMSARWLLMRAGIFA
jgi:hypothetical protein